MRMVLEIALALLAVLGLIGLCWLFFGWLLLPLGGREVFTLIPARGDAESLEQDLNGLLWLRDGGMLKGNILIADCGLSAAGRTLAVTLAAGHPGIDLCTQEEIPTYITKGGH